MLFELEELLVVLVLVLEKELVSSKEDAFEAFKETISKVENIEDKCALVVFMGKNAPDVLADQIQDYMYDNYDFIEVSITDGGENIYDLVAGLF